MKISPIDELWLSRSKSKAVERLSLQQTEVSKKLDSIRNLFVEQSQILDQSQTLRGVIAERRSWFQDASQQSADLKSQVETNRQQIAQTENQTGWSRLVGVRRLRKLQQSTDELEGKIQSLEQESNRLRQEVDASQKSEEQIQTRLGVLLKQNRRLGFRPGREQN